MPDAEIRDLLYKLSQLEKQKLPSPDAPSEIFGEILAIIATHGLEDELQKYALWEIFHSIGRWIYIIDAVDDLCDDIKSGSYNPLKEEKDPNFTIIKNTLQMTLTSADGCLNKIKFKDGNIEEIIKNIVLLGTSKIEDEVINKTRTELQAMKGKL
jgi:hypothetical protein